MTKTQYAHQKTLQRFGEIAADPLRAARQRRDEQGIRAIGCSGLYLPEEIIHAAGCLPVVLLEHRGPTALADSHVQNYMCGYVRSLMDQVLTGSLSFLDALFVKDCCHELRMIGDLIRWKHPDKVRTELLYFPVTVKKRESVQFLREEIDDMIARTEQIAGRSITPGALAHSIRVYNENRSLLDEFYRLRRQFPGAVGARDAQNVVIAAMCIPKEEHTELLRELCGALREEAAQSAAQAGAGVPVVVSGSLCEACGAVILDAVEAAGGHVVDDDLYTGSRYFNTPVSEEGDPVQALVDAYVHRTGPCPTQQDGSRRLGYYLHKLAQRAGARGIVTVIVKHCEAHYFSNFSDQRNLRELGTPQYTLYTDRDLASEAQVRTRIQSFLESIA